ncbi:MULTISPECIES: hypothetical protein [unclassified Streptomyces]|uniref:hypothetical protein n=1 Tax=unclassified Streptomyces TaxID=2593676 RepID=UPI00093DFD98|nr:hypothetical protein [Streptomyces sp. CB01883]OKJ80710.1 hypothetical protein AMK32_23325 [Streptomyces sp. CB01883]
MRRATILLAIVCLAVGAVGCSKSYDEKAKDCATALTDRTGGDSADKPTVSEAEERVDAFDKTLADMVRQGYESVASDAYDKAGQKTEEGGKSRPKACEPLSKHDYTALLMAKSLDGLGWTGTGGEFDKLKMMEGLRD